MYFFALNCSVASLGAYVLSRRWASAFSASFFAGAIYGFGPFMLGFARFHPTAGSLAASIPWLFCPAAFCFGGRRKWLSRLLCALPFLAILLFFQASIHCRLFAIPIQAQLRLADLPSLFVPLVMARRDIANINLIGPYHIPIAGLIMGFAMLLSARRFGILAILAVGVVLALAGPFLQISPIIWLTFPVLCFSVGVGVGMQALASAGSADKRWLLAVIAAMGSLSIITLLLATKYFSVFAGLGRIYAELFVSTAKMYLLGAVAVAIIYFTARAKLHTTGLRWTALCLATAVDVFLGAEFIVDMLF